MASENIQLLESDRQPVIFESRRVVSHSDNSSHSTGLMYVFCRRSDFLFQAKLLFLVK